MHMKAIWSSAGTDSETKQGDQNQDLRQLRLCAGLASTSLYPSQLCSQHFGSSGSGCIMDFYLVWFGHDVLKQSLTVAEGDLELTV